MIRRSVLTRDRSDEGYFELELNGERVRVSMSAGDIVDAITDKPIGDDVDYAVVKLARRLAERQTLQVVGRVKAEASIRVTGGRPVVTIADRPTPPSGAAGLVAFFAPVKVREQLLGDLEEAYFDNVSRIGPRAAKWSYRYQVLAAAIAFAGPRLMAMSGVAALLKRFGAG